MKEELANAILTNMPDVHFHTEGFDKAVTSIINLVDKEIIGDDEKTEKRGPLWDVACQDCFEIPEDHARNQFRAEQRAKLKGVNNG